MLKIYFKVRKNIQPDGEHDVHKDRLNEFISIEYGCG